MSRTRVRRGKIVEIPEEWEGQVTHPQTIRKRPSKHTHKLRKEIKYGGPRTPRRGERAADFKEDE